MGVKAFTYLYLITEKIFSAKIIFHILRLALKKLKVQRRISNIEYVKESYVKFGNGIKKKK